MSRNPNTDYSIEIDTTPSSTETYVEIDGIENVDWQVNDEVVKGFFIKDNGAGYSDVTGGSLSVVLSGKRVPSCTAQNFIMGLMGKWGANRKSTLKLTAPDGGFITMPCSIQLGNKGGEAVALDKFECTLHSDGAWTSTGASV